MKRIKVTITAVDSLIITSSSGDSVLTSSANYIPGTMLRGIIAGKYIKEKNLVLSAHEDEGFRKLFFGKINYTNSLPSFNGKAAIPVPFSVMKHKSTGEIQDLLVNDSLMPGFKNIRGLAVVCEDKLCGISVDKSMSFHMSRSSEAERIAGKSLDGQVFNYESISPGQVFVGEIIGDEDNLKELMSSISQKTFFGRVGRSRFTQYGTVRIDLGEIEDLEQLHPQGNNQIFVHVLAPIIPQNGMISSVAKTLNDMCQKYLPGVKVSADKVFSQIISIDNFVNIWGMKRPRVQALNAGTVFALEKDQWTADDIQKLTIMMYGGLGQRTQEGFGQMRLWAGDIKQVGNLADISVTDKGTQNIKSGIARKLTQQVVKRFILEQLKQFAYKDALAIKNTIRGKTHFFARLLQELGSLDVTGNNRLMLSDKVRANMAERDKSPYYKAMKQISVHERVFDELLEDSSAEMPYIEDWHTALTRNKLSELMAILDMKISDKEISNGEYFYTYWYWLFRYCRKFAVSAKGGR
ncbi:MAG: hypothetical protein K6C05_08380 [Anaerovibrio sp.]|uniref:hypothetical protein n=1 Tax=Anaerovibrio sp. TaxID=1872532 RepID=UPI0025F7BD8F|nr:hypothetical protein [Anaerovibrio sp.]MCR5176853.1 hypothetical protein [Anaerovibrio sp.]